MCKTSNAFGFDDNLHVMTNVVQWLELFGSACMKMIRLRPLWPGRRLGIGRPRPAESWTNPDQVYEQVVDLIVSEGMVDREKVTPDATFETLGHEVDRHHRHTGVEKNLMCTFPWMARSPRPRT